MTIKGFGMGRKIVVATICSLFVVFALIVIQFYYFKYLLRRHRAMLYGLRTQVAPNVVNSTEPPKLGLDPLVIASLPKFAFKLSTQLDHLGEPVECSVCLTTIVEDAVVRLLPDCNHMFHVECIDMWLWSHTTCPICRTVPEPTGLA
ncbi:zf-RING_2 domain-containing protein [Cephalotus follicularis]|uniref:RING-type E3 ubiquitin transferase n=1 Tax=Cephalotus follicularis TaxID=3775 RepID=A0A1Q3CEV2_CEPFO|nr:zf-RING_2 domain-containing protein [Cephalotus follicularis]